MNEESQNAGADSPRPPRKPRSERREQATKDVLRTFIRDLYVDRFGTRVPEAGEVDMVIHAKVKPADNWKLDFETSLAEQLIPQIDDAQAARNVFQPGCVYCFRCETSNCEHATPPTPLSVFRGYASNGLAEWEDLLQAFVDARDQRVDRLFESRDALARVQFGRELKDEQLSSFGRGSKTYSILGQGVAGYFHARTGGEAERLALTFQIVEVRGGESDARLKLNVLARPPADASISDLLASGCEPGVYRAREAASRELAALEAKVRAQHVAGKPDETREAMRHIPAILRRLAESLERSKRQAMRRTRHVEIRRQEQRPVHKALEDSLNAGLGQFFHDEKAGTGIVCGPQGRAHAFTPEGKHVTSFTIRPQTIDFRVRTRRWQPMPEAEAAEFRERIRAYVPDKAANGGERGKPDDFTDAN